jgi:hypothetical protein
VVIFIPERGLTLEKKEYDNVFREIKRLNTMTMDPKRRKKKIANKWHSLYC